MFAGSSGTVTAVPNRQTRRSVEVCNFNNCYFISITSTLKMENSLFLNVGSCVEIILKVQ